jgi:hypothetical protein
MASAPFSEASRRLDTNAFFLNKKLFVGLKQLLHLVSPVAVGG